MKRNFILYLIFIIFITGTIFTSCNTEPERGIMEHTSELIGKVNDNINSFSGNDYKSLIGKTENILYTDSSYYHGQKDKHEVKYMMAKVLCTNMYKNMLYSMKESKNALYNPLCSEMSKKEFLKEMHSNFSQYQTGLNAYLSHAGNKSEKEKMEILAGLLTYTSGEQIEASMLSINLNFAAKNRTVLKHENDSLMNESRKRVTGKIMNKYKD